MTRSGRARARSIGLFAVASCVAAVACTAFDDVPLPNRGVLEAGVPATDAPETAADSGVPAALPGDGFVTEAEAIRACTVIAACPFLAESIVRSLRVAVAEAVVPEAFGEHPDSDQSFSFCVEQLSRSFEPQRPGRDTVAAVMRKIAVATSCREAGKNLHLDLLPPGDPRCPLGADAAAPTCLDDVTALSCDPTMPLLWHCAAPPGLPSGTCMTIDAGASGFGGCILPDGVCPACDGPVLTSCAMAPVGNTAYRSRNDCSAIGLECAINPGNAEIGCAGPDHVIRSDLYFFPGTYCQGTKLVLSNAEYAGIFDCASIGAVCAETNGAAVCSMPEAACTPFSAGANTCQGSKIHLCVGGQWRDVECALGCEVPDGSPGRGACRASLGDGG